MMSGSQDILEKPVNTLCEYYPGETEESREHALLVVIVHHSMHNMVLECQSYFLPTIRLHQSFSLDSTVAGHRYRISVTSGGPIPHVWDKV